MNMYVELTNQFNEGRLRAVLSSGQAVVLHHLAIMSKDGDWIVREDDESSHHILRVLERYGAKYRFGAPLDKRWLAGGWSSHFEFIHDNVRIRTDFVSRPPRIDVERLKAIWNEQQRRKPPFVDIPDLIELKKTNREKDYVIIGDLARKIQDTKKRILYSRSAREIIEFFEKKPEETLSILKKRNIDTESIKTLDLLEASLDAERRRMIHENEDRLNSYISVSEEWKKEWKKTEKDVCDLPLLEAHKVIVNRAECLLPLCPSLEADNGRIS